MMKYREMYLSKLVSKVEGTQELCVVCLEKEATRACIPCAHDVVCGICYDNFRLNVNFCPLCRQEIKMLSKTK